MRNDTLRKRIERRENERRARELREMSAIDYELAGEEFPALTRDESEQQLDALVREIEENHYGN